MNLQKHENSSQREVSMKSGYFPILLVCLSLPFFSCSTQESSRSLNWDGKALSQQDPEDLALRNGTVDSGSVFSNVGALVYANQFFCTATLVSDTIVLTAAHCLKDIEDGQLSIRDIFFTLSPDLGKEFTAISVKDFRVKSFDINHQQNGVILDSAASQDIAVLKLSKPLNLPSSGAKIFLPAASVTLKANADQDVVGYGIFKTQKQLVNGVNRDINVFDGKRRYGKLRYTRTKGGVHKYTPGGGTKKQIICAGDSGGPIFTKVASKNLIVGVNSYVSYSNDQELCKDVTESSGADVRVQLSWIQQSIASMNIVPTPTPTPTPKPTPVTVNQCNSEFYLARILSETSDLWNEKWAGESDLGTTLYFKTSGRVWSLADATEHCKRVAGPPPAEYGIGGYLTRFTDIQQGPGGLGKLIGSQAYSDVPVERNLICARYYAFVGPVRCPPPL